MNESHSGARGLSLGAASTSVNNRGSHEENLPGWREWRGLSNLSQMNSIWEPGFQVVTLSAFRFFSLTAVWVRWDIAP